VGFKTFTAFRGTPSFVSGEMMKLFTLDVKKGFIDMYYNDLVGLQLSIRSIQKGKKNMASLGEDY